MLASLGGGAAPAAASTAYVVPSTENTPSSVVYDAVSGEANQLVVLPEGERVVFEDSGAEIAPGAGCVATGPRRAVCTPDLSSSTTGIAVTLGDRDDSARVLEDLGISSGAIDGGAGADVLLGGSGLDRLTGGEGDDELDGGAGGDVLDGGAGRDQVLGGDREEDCRPNYNECDYLAGGDAPGRPEPDVFTGSGQDIVDYEGREERIVVDLARGVGGAQGERDTIRGPRGVAGGRGDDLLLGTATGDHLRGAKGDDQLLGREGRDLLIGYGGRDQLDGGDGRDRMRGGPGNDRLLGGHDGKRDRFRCRGGYDGVVGQDARDLIDADCETAGWLSSRGALLSGDITLMPRWVRDEGVVEYRGRCPAARCRGRVEMWTRGHSLPGDPAPEGPLRLAGSGRFDLRRGSGPIHVLLNAWGKRLRSRGAFFRVWVIAADGTRSGFPLWGPID